MPISLEVWGDYALFTRPEMKVERVSYDVMTPSAARGLIEAIYWHPGLRWVIDCIDVCAPIRFTNLRRGNHLLSPRLFRLNVNHLLQRAVFREQQRIGHLHRRPAGGVDLPGLFQYPVVVGQCL